MRLITRLLAMWKLRDTPYGDLCEINQLIVLAGRRCAYDLQHASASLYFGRNRGEESAAESSNWYHERANMWQDVFNPADGGKHYHHRLHSMIDARNKEIERLQALCRANNIDPSDPNAIPF